MTREEATQLVEPFIRPLRQYRVVTAADALVLLGDEGFERLNKDQIRRLGPEPETYYYWNVIDHLQMGQSNAPTH